MPSGQKNDIEEDSGPKKGSEWKIFLWCILIASVLWLLTSMNDDYSNNIFVRIHYLHTPKSKVFIKPLPREFRLEVNARGWDLLGYAMKVKTQDFYVDLNEFKGERFIVSRRLKVSLQQQLSQKISISDIYPDTISLATASSTHKRVPVKLALHTELAKGYQLGESLKFEPDSVTVSGPISVIRHISSVKTTETYLSDLKKITTLNLNLERPSDENISYDINSVKVRIPVYSLTEKTTEVPIEIINPGSAVKLIPGKVTIVYQVTLNRYKQVDIHSFQAVVDGSTVKKGNDHLKVILLSKPEFIYNVRMKPEYVNYIISR